MRTKILTVAIVTLLAATVALLIGVRLFVSGAIGFDDWVMRQVLVVAQTYLVPTIQFDDFDFSPPGTATFHGVRLIAPDGTQVIDANELIVTLGELPRRGKPIVIQGVTIRDGSLRLIADPNDPKTTFKGLAPFVKKSNFKNQDKLPEEVRLSETLDLRSLTLDNAEIFFDPGNGQPPMRLDALSMTMDIESSASNDGVWHRIDLDIDRGDLFRLVIDGRLNLDELAAEFETLTLRVDVGSSSVAALPPQLQQILAEHDARGDLEINLIGAVTLKQWRQSEISGAITIRGFNLGLGDYRLPIDIGVIPIKIGGGSAALGPARFKMLDGVFNGNMSVDLQSETMPAVAEWSLEGLNLRELLRTATPEGKPPRIAGILGSFGSVSMELTRIPDSIDGKGEVHITDGRLANFPGVQELNTVLDVVAVVRGEESLSDRFDAEFGLTDRAIRLDSMTLETNVLLARGTGLVHYDQRLDLSLNAGPMEKVQGLLGDFGEVLGELTDLLVEYHVTGTLTDPEVAVKVLGIGF